MKTQNSQISNKKTGRTTTKISTSQTQKPDEIAAAPQADLPTRKTATAPATPNRVTLEDKNITFKSIEQCAYFLSLQDGHPSGRENEYWLKAEALVRKNALQN